jgi:hypothetical protein
MEERCIHAANQVNAEYFHHEDGGDILFRNVDSYKNHKVSLYPRRQHSSERYVIIIIIIIIIIIMKVCTSLGAFL